MNMDLILTSTVDNYVPGMKGSNVVNYTEVKSLLKDEKGAIIGVQVIDKLTKKEY